MTGDTEGVWDGARLQQVFRNLVSNAIKYGAKDSPVIVRVTGEESAVRLEVKNRGPAIDPSAFEQIFDPLIRGPSEGESGQDVGGLGLGLYIVREIVRAHKGEVTVSSTSEETVFSVYLPKGGK